MYYDDVYKGPFYVYCDGERNLHTALSLCHFRHLCLLLLRSLDELIIADIVDIPPFLLVV